MAKKYPKYYYDPQTLSFKPYERKTGDRILGVVINCMLALALSFIGFLSLSSVIESPSLKKLHEENDRLALQYELLSHQVDDIEEIVADLEDRDDHMYRAIFQSDPVENRKGSFNANSQRYKDLSDLNQSALVTGTSRKIDELTRRIYLQSKSYDELAHLVLNNEDRLAHLPAIQPVKNDVLRREASGYGPRIDPIYGTPKFHHGIDFSVPIGTDVYATADGVVSYTGYDRGGYGYLIKIDHGYDYVTYYAHLKNTNKVRKGQKVKRGDIIAESGHTGKSTAPHLHYEVRYKGTSDNPVYYFFKDLSPEEYDDMLIQLSNSGNPMD